ncbi:serine/threonine-protein kinase [Streptomyces sp. NPDC014773]|uniref:serine/threonine-protein kinase n=1 Tax=Streptomyces sp. NPDC014773 TaxID=3364908 RepID=UPI0036F993BC
MAGSGVRILPARPGDPKKVGPYRVVGRLGTGGMGTVHAALDPHGMRVAVKVIHPAQAEDPEFRARFRREVALSSRVTGPCLIPLLAADTEADSPWLATAYAPGPTLNQHLAAHGPLADGSLHAFAAGTAQALAAIHQAGVVHRDVKPQNVILAPAGPRVLDFGIAHAADGTSVTRTGVMTGTPGWISPEHYRTGTAGPAGDVFAWGALVAYAATGRLPFGTGTPDVVAYRVMSEAPELAGVPHPLRELVGQALAKDPDERPSAPEAAERCVALLAAQTTRVLPVATGTAAATEPTLVGSLIEAEWHIPALDDPAWHGRHSASRKRVTIAAIAVGSLIGGTVGGALALSPDSGSTDKNRSSATSSPTPTPAPTPPGRTPTPSNDTAPGTSTDTATTPTPTAQTDAPLTPRSVREALASVPDPAYTRAEDETQPLPGEWAASTRAETPEETAAAREIRDLAQAMLSTKGWQQSTPEVTFHHEAQTIVVTSGPVPQIPEDHQDMFRRIGEMAACTVASRHLREHPATWPYGRFSVHWLYGEQAGDAPVLGFGDAADGCSRETAGRWTGDTFGLVTAGIPSSAGDEIRVADSTVKAFQTAWDARAGEAGLEPLDAGAVQLGFDPVEHAMYVWAHEDGYGPLGGRAQQSHLTDIVEKTGCGKLLAEAEKNSGWQYDRYVVALYWGDEGEKQILDSGTCPGG